MRKPTALSVQLDFWTRSVSGERVERFEDEPQAGFYKRRMVRNGPWLAVEIWWRQEIDPETGELTSDEILMALRNGQEADPYREWPYLRAISAEEYDALTGAHAAIPDMAATHVAVSLGQMAAIRP